MEQRTQFLLGKMIGLLGSDHDGEVLAAARQIRRLLEAEKLSFGDLVNQVTGGSVNGFERESGVAVMARAILKNERMLKPHELKFVRSMLATFVNNPGFQMTTKQANWFNYLYAEYGET